MTGLAVGALGVLMVVGLALSVAAGDGARAVQWRSIAIGAAVVAVLVAIGFVKARAVRSMRSS